MGPKTFIATGAQTGLNFLIIRMEQWSTIHRLPADMQTGVMCCNIGENHIIFCRHVDHKCYYELVTAMDIIGSMFSVIFATYFWEFSHQ